MARKNTQRMLEQQRLATEGWRDLLGIVLVAALACSLGLGLLFGQALAQRVLMLAGLAVLGLAVPTVRAFARWSSLRDRARRERRLTRACRSRTPRPAEARSSSASRAAIHRAS